MASTVPAKSQPLHNFTLPHLKWNKDRNSSGPHQRRRSIKSPSRRPNISTASPIRQSPLRDSVSATPPRNQSPYRDSAAAAAAAPSPRRSPVHGDNLGKRSPGESSKPHPLREWRRHSPSGGDPAWHLPRHDSPPDSEASGKGKGGSVEHRRNLSTNSTSDGARNGPHSTTSERTTQKFEAKSKAKEVFDAVGTKRSKILIKIPCKSSKTEDENPQQEPLKSENNDEDDCSGEVPEEEKINNNNIDEETKTWNLRPRRPIHKSLNVNGGPLKHNSQPIPERSKAQSPLRSLNNRSGENDGGNGGKKEKRKLSISVSLTKEEIEEDIFSLTGSKPARRPKKRAKNIQKQVDVCFPGLWLVSITADSYKVSENSMKG